MTNGSAERGNLDQFIVAARSAAAGEDLAAFEDALKSVPNAAIVSRGGRPDQPQQLKSRFGPSLIIERNAPLNPL